MTVGMRKKKIFRLYVGIKTHKDVVGKKETPC